MMSGDGLVVRVRPYAAEISANQAAALADAAKTYGNGFIDITNRANLQIRGVSDDNYPPLIAALADAALLDEDQETEVKRNIVITPFWKDGDVSKRMYDALVDALLRFPRFPGKFGFVIDCGETRVLSGVSGDIRIERSAGQKLIVRADGADSGREVTAESAVEAALELVEWFMRERLEDIRRLPKLLSNVELPSRFTGTAPEVAQNSEGDGLHFVPFGVLDADDLASLAKLNSPLRITPWRAILSNASNAASGTRLVSDPDADILKISACAGIPFCPQATVETRKLATELAGKWNGHLHVSGCSKGCAKPSVSDINLVGNNGRFDLVRNGAPWDDALYTNLSPADLETLDLT